jgi:hypothetical protein
MTDLPNKELHAAIMAEAENADCADPVFATAKAIEAFTRGEFSDADQVQAWFSLQRVKQPKLFDADSAHDATATKVKGTDNPWAPNFRGDRTTAITAWIRKFGSASASRMASSANADIAGRPLSRAS